MKRWTTLLCLCCAPALALIGAAAAGAGDGQREATDPHTAIGLYRLEATIDAPPEFVYPYLIDEERIARWNRDDGVSVSFPKGIEPRIGKQIRVVVKAPTDPWMLMEIVRLDPNREVRTDFIDGVLDGDFVWRLEARPAGGARLIHEMRIRPKGALTTFVWEVYGKHIHRQKMRAFMDAIKQVVEADWQAARSAPS